MDASKPQPAEPPANASAAGDRRSAWLIGGVGLLVVVLAVSAYAGARWVNRGLLGAGSGPARGRMQLTSNGRTFQIEPAKGLPQNGPDLVGLLVRRQDNSLFLGTGKIQQRAQPGLVSAPAYDGPVLEAVVTHETQIYRDETDFEAPPPADQSGKIQEVVRTGSLDDIPVSGEVQVWGARTGNRVIARFVVYR